MTIKHIVLSGGAYLGLYQFGLLRNLNENKFFDLSNIETIYATSVGSLIGTILLLNIDWDDLYTYIIEKPWEKYISPTPNMMFSYIQDKGLFGEDFFHELMDSLLISKNLSKSITLKEFYQHTKKTIYIYTIELESFSIVELSHYSHPDLELVKALYMSSSLPFLFKPVSYLNKLYIDGGLLNAYPLQNCIDREIHDTSNNTLLHSILGISFDAESDIIINDSINIFEFVYVIFTNLIKSNREKYKNKQDIKYNIKIPCKDLNLNDCKRFLTSSEGRIQFLKQGEYFGKIFYTYNV